MWMRTEIRSYLRASDLSGAHVALSPGSFTGTSALNCYNSP
jgi:hypothetical protein